MSQLRQPRRLAVYDVHAKIRNTARFRPCSNAYRVSRTTQNPGSNPSPRSGSVYGVARLGENLGGSRHCAPVKLGPTLDVRLLRREAEDGADYLHGPVARIARPARRGARAMSLANSFSVSFARTM